MNLADHIRPLLRDHDCVIIPDFGGLVADVAPARVQPGRQVFSPPTKLVAFNQSLTRNDGLLVDALCQHLGMTAAQAREAVRQAVAQLNQSLHETNRTELPGIGIFRRAAGRGLSFEYTGTDNLLPASYGLPELVARPVQSTNARLAREKLAQPVLRSTGTRRVRLGRVLPGAAIGLVVALLLSANYLMALRTGFMPKQWQASLPQLEWAQHSATPGPASAEPQEAALAQHTWTDNGEAVNLAVPAEMPGAAPAEEMVALNAPAPAEPKPESRVEPVATSTAVGKVAAAPAKPTIVKDIPANKPAALKAAPVAAKAAAAVVPAAPAASTTIKTRTGRFYVVAGAFSSLASAEKVRRAQKTGTARVILPPYGSRLYRLSVADFADKASADSEARRLRTKAHSSNSHLVFNY
jgi:cell division protein FtsN